jgi:hypothetical protein
MADVFIRIVHLGILAVPSKCLQNIDAFNGKGKGKGKGKKSRNEVVGLFN